MKTIIFFLILFNISTFNLKAEIVYIDINFILRTSEVGKSLNTYIDKIKNEDLVKYKEIENQLLNKEKLLIAQQNIINENEFKKRLAELTTEVQEYRSKKKVAFDELNKIKLDKTKEILKILNPIITEYVDLNSISLVIPKKNIIVGKKNLDITNQIIKRLNDNTKKLNY